VTYWILSKLRTSCKWQAKHKPYSKSRKP